MQQEENNGEILESTTDSNEANNVEQQSRTEQSYGEEMKDISITTIDDQQTIPDSTTNTSPQISNNIMSGNRNCEHEENYNDVS